jgi:hypothetical protein
MTLHKKPPDDGDDIWGGHSRESIIHNIKNGMLYLTSIDLVGLHSTISSIQITRAAKQEEQDEELKKFMEEIREYDPEYPEGFR